MKNKRRAQKLSSGFRTHLVQVCVWNRIKCNAMYQSTYLTMYMKLADKHDAFENVG